MSRLIVKNLPKYLSDEKFREHFAAKGEVTDAKLMRTTDGTSRRFGFIGYKSEKDAKEAITYFNHSFINTSKIIVEKAMPHGSNQLPRPWSKYTSGSSAHERLNETPDDTDEFKVEETDAYEEKQKKVQDHIQKMNMDAEDPKLREYLDVMTARSKTQTWANDDTTLFKGDPSKGPAGAMDETQDMAPAVLTKPDDELYDDLPAQSSSHGKAHRQGDGSHDKDVNGIDMNTSHGKKSVDEMQYDQDTESPNEHAVPSEKDQIEDTGRLFIRNLSYSCTEKDVRELFSSFGPLSEVHLPISKDTKQSKGFAYVLFLIPDHAVKAYEALDKQTFQGRLLHIIPAKEKPKPKEDDQALGHRSSVQKERDAKRKSQAGSDFNWNSLYMSSDAIADSIANRLGLAKSDILNTEADNMAVRLALAETQIVAETKEFFAKHGIVLDAFARKERCDTVILVKNIPFGTTEDQLRELFGKFGEMGRVLIPPAGTTAIVEFLEATEGRAAFKNLAYRRFQKSLLYLEKAPEGVFLHAFKASDKNENTESAAQVDKVQSGQDLLAPATDQDDDLSDSATLFVKNLNFGTTADKLRDAFAGIQGYRSSRINVKPDPKKPGSVRSMGFGFVEFKNKEYAQKALDALQGMQLDGHALQLKLSHHHKTQGEAAALEKVKADTTKIIVRNVPFEATPKELRELFSTYGQLKSLRLPKKFDGGHRGFAFLDFVTKQEAKNVYENMANIHLYGRHLVLEWASDEEGVDALREKTGKRFSKEEGLGGRLKKQSKITMDGDEDPMDMF